MLRLSIACLRWTGSSSEFARMGRARSPLGLIDSALREPYHQSASASLSFCTSNGAQQAPARCIGPSAPRDNYVWTVVAPICPRVTRCRIRLPAVAKDTSDKSQLGRTT